MFLIASTTASPALAQSPLLLATGTSFISNTAIQTITDQATAANLGVDLKDIATKAAIDHGISTSSLFNLVDSESGWDPDIPGDWSVKKGIYCSWGLTQQNICAHPDISKEDATDPAWALNKAAKDIADGRDYIYTSCNCYGLVSTRIKNLPAMSMIQPSADPHAGGVAIFYYHDRETGALVKHIAYIKKVADGVLTILEANKDHCKVDTRVVPMSDPYLAGFWG